MKKAKAVCVIPARYSSCRLPGKPLVQIRGTPLIMWVYNNVVRSGAFDEVCVATDDKRIFDTVSRSGGRAVMTSRKHASGTDRVLEAVQGMACDYVVNVQGDEPQIPGRILRDFRRMVVLLDDNTLLTCATDATIEEMNDPDTVKVVCAGNGNALYFSRSSIPHCRGKKGFTGHRHIGIYGFSRMGIARFCAFPRGKLEKAEKLEQLRALEAGMNVRCLFRRYSGFGIDTPRDVVKFRKVLETRQGRKDCKDMTA